MSEEFTLSVQARTISGKSDVNRLRKLEGMVPAIIYGAGKDPKPLTIEHRVLAKALENSAFYSHIIKLNIDNVEENVILKDLQRHPVRDEILHADFMRIRKDKKITVHVPIHFLNEETCIGVKQQGGKILRQLAEIDVLCLPGSLPEYLEIDMKDIELGQSIHLSDVKFPTGVESVSLSHDNDLLVVSVQAIKEAVEEEATEEASPEASSESDDKSGGDK